jgi:Rieske Fe-S protein
MARRDLLRVVCASTGVVCGALAGCGGDGPASGRDVISLPPVTNGRITLALADFPQLQHAGGGLVGRSTGMPDPLAITRMDESTFFALSGVCTHMACILSFNALNASLDCPCHGSSFELDGRVINGPAQRPLRNLRTEFSGDSVGVIAE